MAALAAYEETSLSRAAHKVRCCALRARLLSSGDGERRTRATAGPDFAIFGEAGEVQGVVPTGDASKEVTAVISGEVCTFDVANRSPVNNSRRDEFVGDEFSDPSTAVWVVIIVERHGLTASICQTPRSRLTRKKWKMCANSRVATFSFTWASSRIKPFTSYAQRRFSLSIAVKSGV